MKTMHSLFGFKNPVSKPLTGASPRKCTSSKKTRHRPAISHFSLIRIISTPLADVLHQPCR